MSGNGTLTEKFGPVTVSVDARDVVRMMARQALADVPIDLGFSRISLPPIGQACLGGIYAGRLIDERDRAYALIVAPRAKGEFSKMTWGDAGQRCTALDIGGFRDWALPNRMEALAMFERLHPVVKDTDEAFATDYVYWTSAQHAAGSSGAWDQSFDYGYQNYYRKDGSYRARAVRRVVIE